MFSRPRNIPSRIRHDDTNLPARLTGDSILPLGARARRTISSRPACSYFQEERYKRSATVLLHRSSQTFVCFSRSVNIAHNARDAQSFVFSYRVLIASALGSSRSREALALSKAIIKISPVSRAIPAASYRSFYVRIHVFPRFSTFFHVVIAIIGLINGKMLCTFPCPLDKGSIALDYRVVRFIRCAWLLIVYPGIYDRAKFKSTLLARTMHERAARVVFPNINIAARNEAPANLAADHWSRELCSCDYAIQQRFQLVNAVISGIRCFLVDHVTSLPSDRMLRIKYRDGRGIPFLIAVPANETIVTRKNETLSFYNRAIAL